jgi:hypothetical protein
MVVVRDSVYPSTGSPDRVRRPGAARRAGGRAPARFSGALTPSSRTSAATATVAVDGPESLEFRGHQVGNHVGARGPVGQLTDAIQTGQVVVPYLGCFPRYLHYTVSILRGFSDASEILTIV